MWHLSHFQYFYNLWRNAGFRSRGKEGWDGSKGWGGAVEGRRSRIGEEGNRGVGNNKWDEKEGRGGVGAVGECAVYHLYFSRPFKWLHQTNRRTNRWTAGTREWRKLTHMTLSIIPFWRRLLSPVVSTWTQHKGHLTQQPTRPRNTQHQNTFLQFPCSLHSPCDTCVCSLVFGTVTLCSNPVGWLMCFSLHWFETYVRTNAVTPSGCHLGLCGWLDGFLSVCVWACVCLLLCVHVCTCMLRFIKWLNQVWPCYLLISIEVDWLVRPNPHTHIHRQTQFPAFSHVVLGRSEIQCSSRPQSSEADSPESAHMTGNRGMNI